MLKRVESQDGLTARTPYPVKVVTAAKVATFTSRTVGKPASTGHPANRAANKTERRENRIPLNWVNAMPVFVLALLPIVMLFIAAP